MTSFRAMDASFFTPEQFQRLSSAKAFVCLGKAIDFSQMIGQLSLVTDTLEAMGWRRLCEIQEPTFEDADDENLSKDPTEKKKACNVQAKENGCKTRPSWSLGSILRVAAGTLVATWLRQGSPSRHGLCGNTLGRCDMVAMGVGFTFLSWHLEASDCFSDLRDRWNVLVVLGERRRWPFRREGPNGSALLLEVEDKTLVDAPDRLTSDKTSQQQQGARRSEETGR
ncbi:hypothetical protein Taro_043057 [Colocasia esculenta]|uniref:Uncharacterized protein n=1 Tax=Colocasia esculenta TaxID=4460 RepID=A0A843WQF3_COLES|nr:hypothetical protein [Colocasia esculenta]